MRSKLLSILLVFILAFSLITPVYATETTTLIDVSLPELPVSSYTSYDDTVYRFVNAVLKVGDSYYAFVHLLALTSNYVGYGRSFTTVDGVSGYDLYYIYPVAYGETYKLSDDGTTWTLIYTTDTSVSSNYNASEGHILGADYLPYTEAYNAKTLVVYASPDLEYVRISDDTSTSSKYSYKAYPANVYNVTFTSGSVDGGDSTEPTDPDDSGGSSEGGGFTGSWSDEDKGWLGNLFDDLFSFFNNWWTTKIQPKLDSITASIGNFIENSTENIKTGFSEILTTIFGPIIDSISDYFETQLNLIDKIINLIVNLWENFKSYTFEPVNEFLNGINTTAVNVWLDIFKLPMISDILLISVIIGIFGGLMSFLKSR